MEFNQTDFVENPFHDIDEEHFKHYDEHDLYIVMNYVGITCEIIKLILCISVIVTDILLIHVIRKFNRLQCRVNSYIMHYTICNLLYLLATPILFIISDLSGIALGSHTSYHFTFCFVVSLDNLFFLLHFVFAFALGFDWLITIRKPAPDLKIIKFYKSKYFIPSLYSYGIVNFLIQTGICNARYLFMRDSVIFVTYALIVIFILTLNCLKCREKNLRYTKTVYSLSVANIIVFSWMLFFIYHFIFTLLAHDDVASFIYWGTEYVPEWIGISTTITIVVVLVNTNKHFTMAFAKVFRKSVKDYDNDEENLDESEECVNVQYTETANDTRISLPC